MQNTQFSVEYITETIGFDDDAIAVVIVAAGNATRMNGIDKIFAEIGGIPVIARTMLAFERCRKISNIIVVTRQECCSKVSLLAKDYMITKLTAVTVGGSNRQQSVLNGLKCLPENTERVLIHDGARPLIDNETISKVVCADGAFPCVVCGTKLKDTIKEQNNNIVTKTFIRDKLISIQTPQRVSLDKYLPLIEKSVDDANITDDAGIMENAGFEVYCVDGNERNIKITTMFDLKVAQFLLSEGMDG